MSTPAWLLDVFGAVMLLVAEVSAGQLVAARAWTRRDGVDAGIAVSFVLMGIAMASVLVPGLSIVPHAAWDVAFAALTAWFAWCGWRESRGRGATSDGAAVAGGHYVPPLVFSAAMLYLFAAMTGPSVASSVTSASASGEMAGMPGMASMSSGSTPALHASTLGLVFALLLIACTVHDLDRRAGHAGQTAHADAVRLLLSPAVVKGCQVAAGVTIAFILIIMI